MSARMWKRRVREIALDEIFLDSSNLPEHETERSEGRVVPSLSRRAALGVGIAFLGVMLLFCARAFSLEIAGGPLYAGISRDNTLESNVIFAARGVVYDRNGKKLAWNEPAAPGAPDASSTPYALRAYTDLPGFSILLGFIQYPRSDVRGAWWRQDYAPISGVELAFNDILGARNGERIVETDAHGAVVRQNIESPPQNGADLTLSIDAEVQSALYRMLSAHAAQEGFEGGAAVIMDVRTGQLLAIASFPEYDDNAFARGDVAAVRAVSGDPNSPLLDRAISGLYAPGSIVKPIFAAGALDEGLISPDKIIVSTGAISVPNPYDPAHPSVFRDWTAHGPVDMREALAVSSDEYFYTIGGGYGSQPGLGISGLDKYAELFGLGTTTGIALKGEAAGVVPTPAWKASVFGPGDPWRIGDTYHTAIGQYGFQITPIQAARYVAAIANGGKLLVPRLVASSTPEYSEIGIPDSDLEVVREGMRMAVTSNRSDATLKFLNIPGIALASKTGTAQIGARNEWMNSWSIGFWPASHPRFAYAVVLEHAPAGTPSGAGPGMLPFFEWLVANHPEYLI